MIKNVLNIIYFVQSAQVQGREPNLADRLPLLHRGGWLDDDDDDDGDEDDDDGGGGGCGGGGDDGDGDSDDDGDGDSGGGEDDDDDDDDNDDDMHTCMILNVLNMLYFVQSVQVQGREPYLADRLPLLHRRGWFPGDLQCWGRRHWAVPVPGNQWGRWNRENTKPIRAG